MSLFKRCLRQYVELNLHVSFALLSLVLLTYRYAGIPYNWNYLAFAVLGTLVAYTYIKNVPARASFKSGVLLVLQRSPWWVHALAIISVLLVTAFNVAQQLSLVLFMSLSLGYILPAPIKLAPFRDYGAIKIVIVSLVWSGISVVLPLLFLNHVSEEIVLLFLAQTLWVIVLTIPFEIRDAGKDVLRHPTWPQKLGLLRAKILGTVLLIICALIHLYLLRMGLDIEPEVAMESELPITFWDIPFVITLSLTCFGLIMARSKQSFWYSAFWIEAIPIAWLVMTYFFGINL